MTGENNPNEKEPAFKVVDRRRFNDDGDLKPDAPQETVASTPAQKPVEPSPAPHNEAHKINFSLFIQSLAHQALMTMGLVPWPDTGLIQAHPEQSRETIDILVMLREKTKGNLTPDEDRMFDTLLYELKLTFVQNANNPPRP